MTDRDFHLLPASLGDLSQMRAMEKVCFPLDAWPLIEQIGVLVLPGVVRIKAVQDERMIGFIAGDVRQRIRTGWITTLSVFPEFRRQGVGRALLEACEAQMGMPKVRLAVRKSNMDARRLYLSSGYHQVEVWERYYEGGEDAIVMEKHLPDQNVGNT
jgi:ribosomal-protein-alanine N-acetyltransferase